MWSLNCLEKNSPATFENLKVPFMRLNPDTCLDLLLCFPHFCVDSFLLAIVRIVDIMSIVNVAENLMFCKSVILFFSFTIIASELAGFVSVMLGKTQC